MEKAKHVQANIQITSEKYRSVAARAALLFFLMNDLVKMHTYYIYSLAAFLKVFFSGIDAVTESESTDEPTDEPVEVDPDADADDADADAEDADADADADPDSLQLNDEELAERCIHLVDSITLITFNYIRRGLFERDKLTVATLLTVRVLMTAEQLDPVEVEVLLEGRSAPEPGNMGPLSEWMPELIWPKVKNLEKLKFFNGLGDMMQADSDDWLGYFDNEHCESAKVPGDLKDISIFHKILLLRALRPDRIASLLTEWIAQEMGQAYVQQPALDMAATYAETDSVTPVFFCLFAGVDPTPWVEEIGKAHGFTIENGKFVNVSMGQGQEKPAEALVERFAKTGGWAMMQNCHLMQTWVPVLERLLEVVCENAHEDFRAFISAEPPVFSDWKNMPESLMQSCIKVANEAPADIKSNLRRCWATFSQERIDINTKPTEFKGCCFALCWFHAMVLGRMKFGQMGWSRKYSFNMGDLKICSNVLTDYLDNNPVTPWDDIRYVFGEIMYGGHITDAWDRRTCNVYLSVGMHEGLFKGYEFGATHGKAFTSPDPNLMNYAGYAKYIEHDMCVEQPTLFGLHNNAEIGYLTSVCNNLFTTIMSMSGGGGGDGGGNDNKVRATMDDIMERLPDAFEMVGISLLSKPILDTEEGPYVQVVLQECNRMNVLLGEVRRALVELDKGLKGQLNMTPAMEDLSSCLGTNFVPGRNPFHGCNWEGKAWFSLKTLDMWVIDLLNRVEQLFLWTQELVRPFSMWLPGLFNPTAFITAVMQVTARHEGLALDKMTTETHMSRYYDVEGLEGHPPHDGAFVHGIFIEGARWPSLEELDDPSELAGVPVGGHIVESKLKELLPMLPIIFLRAVQVQSTWEPSSVGYLRHDPHIYEAPMYITAFRGNTYVELSTLDSADDTRKWVLAAVAVIFQSA
jgi:dynein heavy chain